jgi:hypothetical protein
MYITSKQGTDKPGKIFGYADRVLGALGMRSSCIFRGVRWFVWGVGLDVCRGEGMAMLRSAVR